MAQITLTIADTDVPRLLAAIGAVLQLERSATAPEAKQYIVDKVKHLIRSYEYRQAVGQVPAPPDSTID